MLEQPPTVNIASLGRFHAYELAHQMERLGVLKHLYTGYPRWKVRDVSARHLKTYPWLVTLFMLSGRLGLGRIQRAMTGVTTVSFQRWLAAHLDEADIFHCMSGLGNAAFPAARRLGSKTICDRGSTHIEFQRQVLSEEYARWGLHFHAIDDQVVRRETLDYALADLITVPSRFVRQTFIDHGVSAQKLVCIPYGVDLEAYHPVPKQDQVFRVIFAGTIGLRKGIPYLLQAVAGLKIPRLETWLIGAIDDEIRPILAKYQDHFIYKGFVPRAELYRFYSQGSVFVLPSLEEGLALVIAQAMACGLPVITTPNSGAEDLVNIEQEGYIIPARDPRSIHECIEALYINPDLRQKMSISALNCVAQIGGWQTYGETMYRVYKNLLKST